MLSRKMEIPHPLIALLRIFWLSPWKASVQAKEAISELYELRVSVGAFEADRFTYT